jgi:hypothetical protein
MCLRLTRGRQWVDRLPCRSPKTIRRRLGVRCSTFRSWHSYEFKR